MAFKTCTTLDALWRIAVMQDVHDELAKVPGLKESIATVSPMVREPLRAVAGTAGDFIPALEDAASREILSAAGHELAGGLQAPLTEWPRLIAYLWAVAGHDVEQPVFGDVRAHALLLDAARRAETRARSGQLPTAVRHQAEDVLRESAALAALLVGSSSDAVPAWDTVAVFAALLRFRWGTGHRLPSEWSGAPLPTAAVSGLRLVGLTPKSRAVVTKLVDKARAAKNTKAVRGKARGQSVAVTGSAWETLRSSLGENAKLIEKKVVKGTSQHPKELRLTWRGPLDVSLEDAD